MGATTCLKAIQRQFNVNAIGHMRAYAGIHKSLQKGSKIGLISSRMASHGETSSGGAYGYRMSKSALNAFGKSLSADLKNAGIAVAIIHPGMVETDMTAKFGAKAGQEDNAP